MNPQSAKAVKQLNGIKRFLIKNNAMKLRLAAEFPEKWQILISTILSSQTRDETTIKISEILYKKYTSLEKLARAKLSEIKKIVKPVNFYKTKSKNILETAKIIQENFNGKIPETIEELLELPGVGRKVANVYLAEANQKACIGVDTHVSRLAVKLKWTKAKQSQRYKIEKDLEKLFPEEYWNSINYILVRFGRQFRKDEDEILKEIMR